MTAPLTDNELAIVVADDKPRAELPDRLMDELMAVAGTGVHGPAGVLERLTKQLQRRAMENELTDYLGY